MNKFKVVDGGPIYILGEDDTIESVAKQMQERNVWLRGITSALTALDIKHAVIPVRYLKDGRKCVLWEVYTAAPVTNE